MASIARSFSRVPRARTLPLAFAAQPRRFAHQSYGNEQSGHQQGLNETNPKRHLEHPGPEAPASSGSDKKTSSSSQSSSKGKPAIHEPHSAQEDENPDVRKHNEEMRQRHDRSANQLGEEDNKVDKDFWQGDVGDIKQDKSGDSQKQ